MKILLALAATLIAITTLQARTADEVKPLLIGQSVPKVDVYNETGTKQFLPSVLKGKHTILVFYRGGWCPYCSTQMQELAQMEDKFIELGYQIVALSPDSPAMLSTVEKDGELNYTLYSDSGVKAAEAFGVDFTLRRDTLKKYGEYGIDLEKNSGGMNKDRLPVPAVFIIGPDNKIAFTYVNPDYKTRIPGKLLLAAATALKDS